MKFCWHDNEIIDETQKVKAILIEYIKTQGFEEVTGKYGSVWKKVEGYAIREWGFHSDETLEGCIPTYCESKVCLKCGRIKLTYDVEKCIKELQNLIKAYDKKNDREIKAKELRSNLND